MSVLINPGISPQVSKPPPPALHATRSPTLLSRNNSVIMLNDPIADGFEPSIINVQPSEELTRFISDFIFLNLNDQGLEQLEVIFH